MFTRFCDPATDHPEEQNILLKSAKSALSKFDRMISLAQRDQLTRSTTAGCLTTQLTEQSQDKIEVPAFPVSFDMTVFLERPSVTDQSHIYQGMHTLIY